MPLVRSSIRVAVRKRMGGADGAMHRALDHAHLHTVLTAPDRDGRDDGGTE
jgi:hypothetical protein